MANIAPKQAGTLTQNQPKVKFQAFVKSDAVLNNIASTLGDATKAKRFVGSIISAVSTNPALAECTPATIISAGLLGETLDLSPSPQLGHYYIVPFKDTKSGTVNATFQLGYKGYTQLAIRSGQYKKLNVMAIKKGELEYFDPLNEEIKINLMVDDWDKREAAETIGYYAFFELVNGFRKSIYWSKSQMQTHAMKYSPGYKNDRKNGTAYTFWSKDFDGMAYKTMLRQLISKWGIMSIEMRNAFEGDMGFKDLSENATTQYVEQSEDAVVFDTTGEVIEQPAAAPKAPEKATATKPSLL